MGFSAGGVPLRVTLPVMLPATALVRPAASAAATMVCGVSFIFPVFGSDESEAKLSAAFPGGKSFAGTFFGSHGSFDAALFGTNQSRASRVSTVPTSPKSAMPATPAPRLQSASSRIRPRLGDGDPDAALKHVPAARPVDVMRHVIPLPATVVVAASGRVSVLRHHASIGAKGERHQADQRDLTHNFHGTYSYRTSRWRNLNLRRNGFK